MGIRELMLKSGRISETELANRMGTSPQNIHNKMNRDNFKEEDIQNIAAALGYTLHIVFENNDTGKLIEVTDKGINPFK